MPNLLNLVIPFALGIPIVPAIRWVITRAQFEGISADTVPGTGSVLALYAEGITGWGIRMKVVNATSAAMAIEGVDVLMDLSAREKPSLVNCAAGACSPSIVTAGVYGQEEKAEAFPISVKPHGEEICLQLHANLAYYSRRSRHIFFTEDRAVSTLGLEDPSAPRDSEGRPLYHHVFHVRSIRLRVRINDKIRNLPVNVFVYKGEANVP